ncbi:MAG: hypothetical protein IH591_05795 [Bacteroidales bacterium]|nr:hypothetical protein [Bacteroidales bacterium]
MLFLLFHDRELPVHYIGRYLFKKEAGNIYNYVPNRLSGQIAPFYNDARLKYVLDNKLYFHLFYSHFGINTPKVLAFNHKNLFAFGGNTTTISSVNDFKAWLSKIFKQNPNVDSLFLKKIYSSSSGRNVHIIPSHYDEIETPELEFIFQELITSEFVFQQRVKQHPDLSRLNPSSLNTMRIDTFIDQKGNIEIISGFLKMSTDDNPVDNNTSGGCGVGIDLDMGTLKSNGYSKIKMSGVGILKEHPVTGVSFKGFAIPMLEEAKELVLKAAGLMPGLRLIGWDVGISEEGPVLVEGNSDYGINSNDLMYGGYMTNPVFRRVLDEFRQ